MSYAGRTDKTRDKTRRGGLPAPTEHTQIVGRGDGRPCDGCGETIHPSETASLVRRPADDVGRSRLPTRSG